MPFEEYDSNKQIDLYSCQIKTNFSFTTNIASINLNNTNNTFNENTSTNIFKCIKTFFSKDGIKANIGSYITMVIIVINIGSLIYFIGNGTNIVKNELNKILNKNQNSSPIKKRKKGRKNNFDNNIDINQLSSKGKSDSKFEFQNLEGVNNKGKKSPSLDKNKNKNKSDIYNDYELNNLNYNEAII